MKRTGLKASIGVGAVLLALTILWLWSWIEIDRCLDGGGRWNYETSQCQLSDGR